VVLVAVLGPRGEDYRRGETKKVKSHSLLAPIGVLGDISIYKYVYTVYIYIYYITCKCYSYSSIRTLQLCSSTYKNVYICMIV
jgi:hypothetical protein